VNDEHGEINVAFGNIERSGSWVIPKNLKISVRFGNAELDLREAILARGLTIIDLNVSMGNAEIVVPRELPVQVEVNAKYGNVENAPAAAPSGDVDQPRLKIIGNVKLGNCEVLSLAPGESKHEFHIKRHTEERRRAREAKRKRWKDLHAEREMWKREHPQNWMPWWLNARMRRRIFIWLSIALGGGFALGWHLSDSHPRWWWIALALLAVSIVSGGIAWRLTRPLIFAIRAARDIGDGKLDTRMSVANQGGEMRLLGNAINDMAEKIQKQLSDQRQLLAAVSHELRTPLGHMRVLIETARDAKDQRALNELEKEVLVLDDLVGRLLASSRLEFGNLDRRELDLGELVTDAVVSASIDPEKIEAIGEVRAAVDPTLVRRAVANLLENARVHGGGAVAIRIERRGGQIAIEVDDAGPGVAADRRADAFRAFVPSSGGGLGLGLALVSRIAVAHGGGAWISDRPGGGARVGFTIGVAAIDEDDRGAPTVRRKPTTD
jgi:signal transduction histidine kinase